MSQTLPRLTYRLYVGVDVAATSFEAAWQSADGPVGAAHHFVQTSTDWARFQQQLLATGSAPPEMLLVLEATGSYWVALAVHLHAAGFQVSVVNPAQVHAWARSLTRRSKTDALDAQLLSQFASERRPAPWTPPPHVYHELRQRLVARDGLLEMRQQARNQLHALRQWPVVIAAVEEQLLTVIATLDTQLAALDRQVAALLKDGAWAGSARRLASIPGYGPVTIGWILVATANFTTCPTAEALVSYAGLSPLQRESGTSVRGRAALGHGGHGRLRQATYMATLSAAQHNPAIKAFYERLRAAGKPIKVARCAAARKLLHLGFAVVTKDQDFDPAYQQRQPRTTSVPAVAS